jgi:acylphosphatase
MKNLHITLSGIVYKVGLRYYIKQMAKHSGIVGTVRYRDENTIDIDASGPKAKMDQFLSYCKLGCPGSDVKNILVKEQELTAYNSFEIIE